MSCVLILLMAIDVVLKPFGGASTPPFISKGARLQGR
jgi:hypothetical protein